LLTCLETVHPDDYGYELDRNRLSRDDVGVPTAVRASVDARDVRYRVGVMNADCRTYRTLRTLDPGDRWDFKLPQGSVVDMWPVQRDGEKRLTLGPVSGSAPLGYGGASFGYETTAILWGRNLEEVGG
jgi:hypothetical protein